LSGSSDEKTRSSGNYEPESEAELVFRSVIDAGAAAVYGAAFDSLDRTGKMVE